MHITFEQRTPGWTETTYIAILSILIVSTCKRSGPIFETMFDLPMSWRYKIGIIGLY